jgi:hypothetical protein
MTGKRVQPMPTGLESRNHAGKELMKNASGTPFPVSAIVSEFREKEYLSFFIAGASTSFSGNQLNAHQ